MSVLFSFFRAIIKSFFLESGSFVTYCSFRHRKVDISLERMADSARSGHAENAGNFRLQDLSQLPSLVWLSLLETPQSLVRPQLRRRPRRSSSASRHQRFHRSGVHVDKSLRDIFARQLLMLMQKCTISFFVFWRIHRFQDLVLI